MAGGQGTVTYGAPVGGGQETVTYAAPSAQSTVMYSGGVDGGQGSVTYAAPSAQGTVTYSGGVGQAHDPVTYSEPQLIYNAQGQLVMQTSTVSVELQLIDANLLFDRLDVNGDGVISRDECARLVTGAVYA